MTEYLKMLENSYVQYGECASTPPESRLEYLGDQIFDFTTYDSEMAVEFARKAIEVCGAITRRTTFQYIADEANYRWFLLLCNMPFFAGKIDWGTSIRGAFWNFGDIELRSLGLWADDDQITAPLKFTNEEWVKFCLALIAFAEPEMGVK